MCFFSKWWVKDMTLEDPPQPCKCTKRGEACKSGCRCDGYESHHHYYERHRHGRRHRKKSQSEKIGLPFDNRRRQFRYEPRHGGQPALIYQLPDEAAAPAPAPAAQPGPAPAVQHVPYTLYIGLEYCGGVLGAYPYVQYYQYPATAAAPASAAAPTYVHYPHAHSYQAYFTNTTTQPAAGANGNTIYGQTAAEVQVNDRRLATQRGAYEAKPIKPVANPDDVFWCRERDGQWTLRPFYNIDNDLKPGRWTMDAEKGYCVYHRE